MGNRVNIPSSSEDDVSLESQSKKLRNTPFPFLKPSLLLNTSKVTENLVNDNLHPRTRSSKKAFGSPRSQAILGNLPKPSAIGKSPKSGSSSHHFLATARTDVSTSAITSVDTSRSELVTSRTDSSSEVGTSNTKRASSILSARTDNSELSTSYHRRVSANSPSRVDNLSSDLSTSYHKRTSAMNTARTDNSLELNTSYFKRVSAMSPDNRSSEIASFSTDTDDDFMVMQDKAIKLSSLSIDIYDYNPVSPLPPNSSPLISPKRPTNKVNLTEALNSPEKDGTIAGRDSMNAVYSPNTNNKSKDPNTRNAEFIRKLREMEKKLIEEDAQMQLLEQQHQQYLREEKNKSTAYKLKAQAELNNDTESVETKEYENRKTRHMEVISSSSFKVSTDAKAMRLSSRIGSSRSTPLRKPAMQVSQTSEVLMA